MPLPGRDMLYYPATNLANYADKPLTACVKINNRCHFKCFRCQSSSVGDGCQEYDLDEIVNALVEIAPPRIVWNGGDTAVSPRLKNYIERTTDQGLANIVNTNMVVGDRLGELAGAFFYQVGLHGTNQHEFKSHTGWDQFEAFKRHFIQLFEIGHAVTASMVVKADWRDYLEKYVRWLDEYPIRRLLISNSAEAGTNLFGFHRIEKQEIAAMKFLVQEISPKFPVVFPLSDSKEPDGSILIEPVPDGSALARINEEKALNKENFIQRLKNLGPDNLKRYRRQNYYLP